MKRIHATFLLLLACFWLWFPFSQWGGLPARAGETGRIPTVTYEGALLPDWSQLSFQDFGPIESSGGFTISDLAAGSGYSPAELVEIIGYDPSRSWSPGTPIADLLKLGDFAPDSSIANWTLQTIAQYVPLDLSQFKLSDFPALKAETIEHLVLTLPSLGGFPLQEVLPIYDAVKNALGVEAAADLASVALQDLATELAGISLAWADLSQYPLTELPGLEALPFGDLVDWKNSFVSQIPGLQAVPLASFLVNLAAGGFLAQLDIVYGEKEANRTNTITGSYQAGFQVPCVQPNCAHLELTDALATGPYKVLHGKQWISGKSQQVPGGWGVLAWVNDGKEPTGRHPFGEAFKVVLTETVESEGKAGFSIYFRFCVNTLLFQGCTPYFIGPVPWFSHHEKDLIFVGLDGVAAAVPPHLPPVPPNPGLPPGLDLGIFAPGSEVSFSDGDCDFYRGVDFSALKRTIATIESEGSGGYTAVGIHLCNSDGCGRALGKYQYMSYREDVIQVIGSKSGGTQFLAAIRDNTISVAEIKAQLTNFFTPAEQEKLYDRWVRQLIDQAINKGKKGDEVIRYVGQRYGGGYADKAVDAYNQEKGKAACSLAENGDGKCSGSFEHPAPGYPQTDKFGSCRPLGGPCKRLHEGADIGTPTGTKVKASDGGTVSFVGTMSGYGLVVDISHCGKYTSRYAHLSKALVEVGQSVSKNQVIALSGASGIGSGPHLHFEIREGGRNGTALNPKNFVKGIQ